MHATISSWTPQICNLLPPRPLWAKSSLTLLHPTAHFLPRLHVSTFVHMNTQNHIYVCTLILCIVYNVSTFDNETFSSSVTIITKQSHLCRATRMAFRCHRCRCSHPPTYGHKLRSVHVPENALHYSFKLPSRITFVRILLLNTTKHTYVYICVFVDVKRYHITINLWTFISCSSWYDWITTFYTAQIITNTNTVNSDR